MTDLIDFRLDGDSDEVRERSFERARLPLPLSDYLDFLTDWTERMFPDAKPRDNSRGFDRPFDLFERP